MHYNHTDYVPFEAHGSQCDMLGPSFLVPLQQVRRGGDLLNIEMPYDPGQQLLLNADHPKCKY